MIVKLRENERAQFIKGVTGLSIPEKIESDVYLNKDNDHEGSPIVTITLEFQGFGRKTKIIKESLVHPDMGLEALSAERGVDTQNLKKLILKDKRVRNKYAPEMVTPLVKVISEKAIKAGADEDFELDRSIAYRYLVTSDFINDRPRITMDIEVDELTLMNFPNELACFIDKVTITYGAETSNIPDNSMLLTIKGIQQSPHMEVMAVNVGEYYTNLSSIITKNCTLQELENSYLDWVQEEQNVISELNNANVEMPDIAQIGNLLEPSLREIQNSINYMVSQDSHGELEEQLLIGEMPTSISEELVPKLEATIDKIVSNLDIDLVGATRIEVIGKRTTYDTICDLIENAIDIRNIL